MKDLAKMRGVRGRVELSITLGDERTMLRSIPSELRRRGLITIGKRRY
jgi:hypothetical protein